jgi:hypothetical protein
VAQVFEWDFTERLWRHMELENTIDVVLACDQTPKRPSFVPAKNCVPA